MSKEVNSQKSRLKKRKEKRQHAQVNIQIKVFLLECSFPHTVSMFSIDFANTILSFYIPSVGFSSPAQPWIHPPVQSLLPQCGSLERQYMIYRRIYPMHALLDYPQSGLTLHSSDNHILCDFYGS